jgi:predicted RNase H-like nuclease (RuvC/YqgF family)
MGKSGKALTFILIVFVVLLVSVTGISLFFFLKEIDARQAAEAQVDQLKTVEAKLNSDLKSAQEQITLLDEKKREAEEKIEGLLQEVDLQKTTKEEVQKENLALQDNLQKETQAKEEIKSRLTQDLQAAQDKYNSVKSELDKALARSKELEDAKSQLEAKMQSTTAPAVELTTQETTTATGENGIALDKIVVNPNPSSKGRVISVDSDTDFVIVSLGEKDGINKGALLSIFRGQDYLGDVKVSRVLAEMSAADFVPPFKSQNVKKDDQVVVKK